MNLCLGAQENQKKRVSGNNSHNCLLHGFSHSRSWQNSYSKMFLLIFSPDNGFIPESLLEDVMKALDLVSDPE